MLSGVNMLCEAGDDRTEQVFGRLAFVKEFVRLHSYYVDNWSMNGDLVIMARTMRAVGDPRGLPGFLVAGFGWQASARDARELPRPSGIGCPDGLGISARPAAARATA